jgi:hypothetical protein
MSGIVCAIRGGSSSRPTVNQAILTANETGLPPYFLYVLNAICVLLMRYASGRLSVGRISGACCAVDLWIGWLFIRFGHQDGQDRFFDRICPDYPPEPTVSDA